MGTVPTYITRDTTLRVKILDACGMTCTFCHNEGTPVAADNRSLPLTAAGSSGRVSIYTPTNGAQFVPATMMPGPEYVQAISTLRDALDLTELHLTGGEPTLHPRLAELVRLSREAGYSVRMTSNGENGARVIPAAADAGLEKVNFSIFGTTPAELAQVQHSRFADEARAAAKIAALKDSIRACLTHGVRADANIVVVDHTHIARVHRLLDEYSPQLSVRLLNSLDDGQESLDAIDEVLRQRGAVIEAHHITAGVSGFRTSYLLPEGRRIYVKRIRPTRLPRTCTTCRFNNDRDCQEGFYGVRLYRSRTKKWLAGLCIQRMDLCQGVGEFASGDAAREVRELRDSEHDALVADAHTQTKG
ncbi:radical SAM protein [Saccharomonospora cyanea]|uniref:Molybdenum cofactor biosynthesis enzyme n=1 Tax=Saccharomonospora cyanea NA-134 TaxID=882082 RepID=H5XG36_9PSEU|nr:radical SAM protein [Saccharomonospora cyanea]EHR62618.1 molybdenum cofactor biosynthesis enzyme [Saccharomonospora cyanea NA-134]